MVELSDMTPRLTAVRVCVVDSARAGPAYPPLQECVGLEVVGQVPWFDQRFLAPDFVDEADIVIVGADATELAEAEMQSQLARLARRAMVVLVMPGVPDVELAAQLGVRGLVSRDVAPDALVRVVHAVAAGEIAFPRSALGTLFGLIGRLPIPLRAAANAPLTPRQREVVALIAGGATDREVAAHLRISESTAHKHVQNALRRSRAKTRSQLVALLRQESTASS